MRLSSLFLLPLAAFAVAAPAPKHELDERSVIDARAVGAGAAVTPSSNANLIKSLQFLLTARGHGTAADGAFGSGTTGQVKAFQKASGIAQDGQVGPATLTRLVTVVKSGSSGDFAKAAQSALNAYGNKLAVDGAFGTGSVAAAKSFQSSKKLTADGIVGDGTWTALFGGAGGGGGGDTGGGGGNCDSVKGGVNIGATVLVSPTIRVHACLAPAVKKMIADAAADGVKLTANSSWRSPDQQIALRKQNCGTTHYDIYDKPSGQCHPPTATPGSSRHERGLAIDFANAARGGAVYTWLSKHAANYHLHVLSTGAESWHWSWDGA